MARPGEKLADALEVLSQLQNDGKIAIRSADLSRLERERLIDAGFLREVIRGWYIPARPDEPVGESTSWFASFWGFCTAYLTERFADDWILSPDQSLLLLSGNRTVPKQLLVRAPGGRNKPTTLIHGTSLIDTKLVLPPESDRTQTDEGVRVYRIEAALISVSPQFYTSYPTDARTALATQRDASALLERLLEGGHSVVAGRLAGGFRNIGRDRIADDIVRAMKSAGYDVREADPFAQRLDTPLPRDPSPAANRIRLMWQQMRERAIAAFPAAPRLNDTAAYLERVDENYVNDAYNSLSIEGYRVNAALIERVRDGNWNPDLNPEDREQKDAMAARGYWQAFQAVKASVERVLAGEGGGRVADEDHSVWYSELFAPGVQAGILRPGELAGYRNSAVFIRGARHVPMGPESVRDAVPVFFELLQEEPEAAVRVVLGHFIFVYIHPYIDGNGRMGRFLMNVMMASGGYPWTVIPVGRRAQYMAALEQASTEADIGPFAEFLGGLVAEQMQEGE
ncbi:Fic family protein [Novosphingobium mangrovi (ex Hu et al. 2023)]|uniref:Fic family protein n=1 Tax=Novosphingobium mangrovi (ex Hu et al. 2023) TaxID=2930094 RepID=A0ABT0AHC8_9SPHN|nr:Fic family protein [Novosphingobium mangrovi (ex Hu et al. 2023)]MCJ1962570.1 Fic family protein [Novosphingobium mangrovi (ex Hu et al. 2023)]